VQLRLVCGKAGADTPLSLITLADALALDFIDAGGRARAVTKAERGSGGTTKGGSKSRNAATLGVITISCLHSYRMYDGLCRGDVQARDGLMIQRISPGLLHCAVLGVFALLGVGVTRVDYNLPAEC
jgi:hypothetical protein